MRVAGSPLDLFLFLARRGLVNVVRKRLRKLREPRYLVGLVVGIGYFALMIRSNGGRGPHEPGGPAIDPADLQAFGGEIGAFGLLVVALFTLLLKRADAALPLSEAESLFLFSAPLPRRSVLHFAFLRVQLLLLVPALVTTVLLGRGLSGRSPRAVAAALLGFSFLHLFSTAVAFTKAGWEELPDAPRRLRKAALLLFVAAAIAGLSLLGWERLTAIGSAGRHGLSAPPADLARLVSAVEPSPAWRALLFPTSLLARPLFASGEGAARDFAPALALLAGLYAFVASRPVRYEERTLQAARRRAETVSLRRQGRPALPASARGRRTVPFRLHSAGAPELAIVWKNLVAFHRVRLRVIGYAAAGTLVAAALLPALAAWLSAPRVSAWAGVIPASFLVLLGVTLPFGVRADLRADLERAEILRLWPLSATRLVAAQLATPFLLSTALIWLGLAIPLSTALGVRTMGLASGLPPALSPLDLLPLAISGGLLLPSISALLLVVQNAATLAFPDWFPPGAARQAGIQASGMRILLFVGTYLALLLGLIPALILAVPALLVGWEALRFWVLPVSSALAAAALLAESGLGIFVLARLWARFDPSRDLAG